MAHALDFDDVHFPSVLHPSASVVQAGLAVASACGASIGQLVNAVAIGNELAVRAGMAGYDDEARNSIFFARGFHATSICGAIGSAVTAGLLLGLDEAQLAHAIAVACSFGSGLIEANRTGGTVKQVHCGWGAFGGVTAAQFVRNGITGPATIFEGGFGFVQAFCGERGRPEWIVDRLGDHWEMANTSFKPYPTNGFVTGVVDAAVELRGRGGRPENVINVEIHLPAPVLRTVAQPWQEKVRPRTPYHGRFSAPFVFSLALAGGGGLGLALDDFTDAALADPRLLALREHTTVTSDSVRDNAFPEELSTLVRATMADQTVQIIDVPHMRGGPSRPLTDAEVRRKFTANCLRTIDGDSADEIYHMLSKASEEPARLVLERTTDTAEPALT